VGATSSCNSQGPDTTADAALRTARCATRNRALARRRRPLTTRRRSRLLGHYCRGTGFSRIVEPTGSPASTPPPQRTRSARHPRGYPAHDWHRQTGKQPITIDELRRLVATCAIRPWPAWSSVQLNAQGSTHPTSPVAAYAAGSSPPPGAQTSPSRLATLPEDARRLHARGKLSSGAMRRAGSGCNAPAERAAHLVMLTARCRRP
jgi:hypothetical protein